MALSKKAMHSKDDVTRHGYGKMQHQHFRTIAGIIKGIADQAAREGMATYFASELRHTNPNFDRARFLRACGFEEE